MRVPNSKSLILLISSTIRFYLRIFLSFIIRRFLQFIESIPFFSLNKVVASPFFNKKKSPPLHFFCRKKHPTSPAQVFGLSPISLGAKIRYSVSQQCQRSNISYLGDVPIFSHRPFPACDRGNSCHLPSLQQVFSLRKALDNFSV